MARLSRDDSTLVAAMIELLSERPLTDDELDRALAARGLTLGPDPEYRIDELLDTHPELGPVVMIGDTRLGWAPALLEGRVLTHVLGHLEVAHDVLLPGVDLAPLSALLADWPEVAVTLQDGTTIRSALPLVDRDVVLERAAALGGVRAFVWLLEPGWFAAHAMGVGDTITVTVGDGRLRIGAVSEPPEPAEVARTRAALHGIALAADLQSGHEIEPLVLEAVAADPTLFRTPGLPLGELLVAEGFTIQGDFLALPGVDLTQRRGEHRLQHVMAQHDLSEQEAGAVLALVMLVQKTRDLQDLLLSPGAAENPALVDTLLDIAGGPTEAGAPPSRGSGSVAKALELLADPDVAQAALVECLHLDDEDAPALELVAGMVEPMVARKARPALRWLQGKAQDRMGRCIDAEATIESAYSMDPQWAPVLEDLARFASDRGDAERGISLLQRAGVEDDDPLLLLLEEQRAPDRGDLGRNDPCWCGSGRRYKACHRGRERLDLPARTRWLYAKATLHVMEGPGRLLLLDVVRILAGSDDPRDLLATMRSETAMDLTLFEGGAFAQFIEDRGHLLPDDERLLAEQWVLVERSVHEVEAVRIDRGFTARDIRTGDRVEVTERLASRQLAVGDLVLARLVPDSRGTVVFGGLERIDLARRDSLMALLDQEPDAIELAGYLAALHAPPVLLNADGGQLLLCEARIAVDDVEAVAAWLDSHLVPVGDDAGGRWHVEVETPAGASVRAAAAFEDGALVITSPSEDRFDELLDALEEAFPSFEILEETRVDPRESADVAVGPPDLVDPRDADPEIAELLRRHTRAYEQRWLDESIPALGGVTPREAAADPTRRHDLVRLLDSFPIDDDNPGAMSAARLRQDLGLG